MSISLVNEAACGAIILKTRAFSWNNFRIMDIQFKVFQFSVTLTIFKWSCCMVSFVLLDSIHPPLHGNFNSYQISTFLFDFTFHALSAWVLTWGLGSWLTKHFVKYLTNNPNTRNTSHMHLKSPCSGHLFWCWEWSPCMHSCILSTSSTTELCSSPAVQRFI